MPAGYRQDQLFYKKYLYNIILLYKNRDDVRMFLEILLSLATVVIFAIFAIKPTLVTIATLITEINSKQEIITQMDQKIQNISTAQQIFEQNRSVISLLNTAVPSSADPHHYIRQIEAVAARHSLQFEGVNTQDVILIGDEPLPPVSTAPLDPNEVQPLVFPLEASPVEMTLNVSGEYPNLLAFLKDVQILRRPILIDSISFDKIPFESQEKIILTIVGRIPFIK